MIVLNKAVGKEKALMVTIYTTELSTNQALFASKNGLRNLLNVNGMKIKRIAFVDKLFIKIIQQI